MLFQDYDAAVPPYGWVNEGMSDKPEQIQLHVQLGLNVRKVVAVDIVRGTVQLSTWLRMKWYDHRLDFNGSNLFGPLWQQYKRVSVESNAVWKPDVVEVHSIKNSDEDFLDTRMSIMEVNPDDPGWNIFWSRPGLMESRCNMDLTKFPFDVQRCELRFEAWTHHSGFLSLQTMANGSQQTDELKDEFHEYTFKRLIYNQECGKEYNAAPGSWSAICVTFELERLPLYYLSHSILPLMLLVCLTTATAWLAVKPDHSGSGERLSFTLTLLLTMFALMLFTADKRPMLGSDAWLDQFQSWCIFLTVLPVLETIFIMWVYRNSQMEGDDIRSSISERLSRIGQFISRLGSPIFADENAAVALDSLFRHVFPVVPVAVFCYKLRQVYEPVMQLLHKESLFSIAIPAGLVFFMLFGLCICTCASMLHLLCHKLCWRMRRSSSNMPEALSRSSELSSSSLDCTMLAANTEQGATHQIDDNESLGSGGHQPALYTVQTAPAEVAMMMAASPSSDDNESAGSCGVLPHLCTARSMEVSLAME